MSNDERDAVKGAMYAAGLLPVVPEGDFDECKRFALEFVDLSDFQAERAIRAAFDKVDLADMIISVGVALTEKQSEQAYFKIIKMREDTGNRRLLSFQRGSPGVAFLPKR